MDDAWTITYSGYNPDRERHRETLCTLGNGYVATRGSAEESSWDAVHYPGTYLAGGYNRLKTDIGPRVIEHEDLVNWPNWLTMKWKHEGGEWIGPDRTPIKEYYQTLDLQKGLYIRHLHYVEDDGRETLIISRRLVHMSDAHMAALQWKLIPLNWSGNIIIHSALDGRVTNSGVSKYKSLKGKHLRIRRRGDFKQKGIFLQAETVQSEIKMAQAAKTEVYFDRPGARIRRKLIEEKDYIAQELTFPAEKNESIAIEKTVSLYSSRDYAISDTVSEAKKTVVRAGPFDDLCGRQAMVMDEIWKRLDTRINCGSRPGEQVLLRLHIFHLFQTLSFNSIDMDTGVPSRGWHGEAYWGHVFWDELFIFPIVNLSVPELTRSLLLYRYRRLPEARFSAHESGCKGAMFPWQSGSNGREETHGIHYNAMTGTWVEDNFQLQRHVNSAICYNVWQYVQVTDDLEFLAFYGAEIMLEIAVYWADKATWNESKQKYEIKGVIGPDEYHTSYPDSNNPGINNNAYTNVMAVWVLQHARQALDKLDQRRTTELTNRLQITNEDMDRWDVISANMFIPFSANGKIIHQFEGFENLAELDWDKYKAEYGEIMRLDDLLEKEGDRINRYKAVKQADVLMLFYLFSAEELTGLFNTAGYRFNPQDIPANIEYYESRTSHGSTLSKVVHSWVLARAHRQKSWKDFLKALDSDYKDVQGGTTEEGIHLGAMAGTVDLVQRCYTGLEMREDALWFNPQLPEELHDISYQIYYRGKWITLHLTRDELKLSCRYGWSGQPVPVRLKGRLYQLNPGEEKVFSFINPA